MLGNGCGLTGFASRPAPNLLNAVCVGEYNEMLEGSFGDLAVDLLPCSPVWDGIPRRRIAKPNNHSTLLRDRFQSLRRARYILEYCAVSIPTQFVDEERDEIEPL